MTRVKLALAQMRCEKGDWPGNLAQAEAIRDLERGQFLALGPAMSKRAIDIRIGSVRTSGKGAGLGLMHVRRGGGFPLQHAE